MYLIASCFFINTLILLKASELNRNCPEVDPNQTFNSKQLSGVWYAVRGIEHTLQPKSKAKRNKICPEVKIANKNDDVWEFEWTANITRTFKLKEVPNSNGRLTNAAKGGSIGEMIITTMPGTNNLWAATICKKDVNHVASAILSSTPEFKKEPVEKLTTILQNKGLNTDYIYDGCT